MPDRSNEKQPGERIWTCKIGGPAELPEGGADLRLMLTRSSADASWMPASFVGVESARRLGWEVVEVMPCNDYSVLRELDAVRGRYAGLVSIARDIAGRGVLAGQLGNLRAALEALDAESDPSSNPDPTDSKSLESNDPREQEQIDSFVGRHRDEILAFGDWATLVHPEDLPPDYRPGMRLAEWRPASEHPLELESPRWAVARREAECERDQLRAEVERLREGLKAGIEAADHWREIAECLRAQGSKQLSTEVESRSPSPAGGDGQTGLCSVRSPWFTTTGGMETGLACELRAGHAGDHQAGETRWGPVEPSPAVGLTVEDREFDDDERNAILWAVETVLHGSRSLLDMPMPLHRVHRKVSNGQPCGDVVLPIACEDGSPVQMVCARPAGHGGLHASGIYKAAWGDPSEPAAVSEVTDTEEGDDAR